ncbi:MAG: 4-hydroxy-tetrahydrodipicolinate synthase [Turneriella sp.]|nr:4-hydroxy-tetrahydrodipicolinate synthase [Turneriella sp.]
MATTPLKLEGTYTALITPFTADGEKVDWQALKKIVEWQLDAGVDGLVPCGTTGESPTLSHEEHAEVIARVIEWAKAKNPKTTIIAGTGSNSTAEAIALTRHAASSGADAVLSVNPYYNKPTQAGLLAHFARIADNSRVPVILYNIPGRSAVGLSLETVAQLAQHGNIIGIKEATGDLGFMAQIIEATCNLDFTLLSGDDNLLLPVLSIGGKGVISVISNIYPKETAEIPRLFFGGKIAEAQKKFLRLLPLCKAMFIETNPIPVKFAAAAKGLCENVLRLPMTPLSPSLEGKVKETMARFENSPD